MARSYGWRLADDSDEQQAGTGKATVALSQRDLILIIYMSQASGEWNPRPKCFGLINHRTSSS
jgi:hypothetical protein